MEAIEFQNQLNTIDLLIKQNQIRLARKKIADIPWSEISRHQRCLLSHVCRRAGWSLRSIRILKNVIHPEGTLVVATESEVCSYAASLISLGARNEAKSLLKQLVQKSYPEALLHRSFLHMQEWDYSAATYFIRRYVKTQKKGTYSYYVGLFNLASCLIVLGQSSKAWKILEQMKFVSKQNDYIHLMHQVVRLRVQVLLQQKQFDEALQEIVALKGQDRSIHTVSDLLLEKWRWIVELETIPYSSSLEEQAGVLRMAAEKLGNWETVRDCDFHLARKKCDVHLFQKVYFGTSSIFYRNKMMSELENNSILRSVVQKTMKQRDVQTWALPLNSSSLVYRLLSFLSKETYKKFSAPELFAELYPDEYFHPQSSLARISRLIQRARKILSEYRIPLILENSGHRICLSSRLDHLYRIEAINPSVGSNNFYSYLQTHWKGRTFTAKQLIASVKCSRTSLFALLKQLMDEGKIKKIGGRAVGRYILHNHR